MSVINQATVEANCFVGSLFRLSSSASANHAVGDRQDLHHHLRRLSLPRLRVLRTAPASAHLRILLPKGQTHTASVMGFPCGQQFHCEVTGKLFTRMCLSRSSIIKLVSFSRQWYPTAGKVTVGQASNWSCIIDISSSFTCGLRA